LISSASVFHRYPSCCSPVFHIPAAHHQRDRVIRQRPLQRLGLIPWRVHPQSRSSSVVRITGMALRWIGSTIAFDDVVRKP
jgi:hypothetical protein